MTVLFRVRTSAGQELSFATHEMFEDFVRSGELSPDDLVYDGEIGSWAPARTHPLVLEIEYEDEESTHPDKPPVESSLESEEVEPATEVPPSGEGEGAIPTSTADSESPGSAGSGDAFGLDLAPAADLMSVDEAAQAFIEKMDAERESAADMIVPGTGGMQGFTMENPDGSGAVAQPEATPVRPPPTPRPERVRRDAEPRPRTTTDPPQRPKEGSRGGAKVLMGVMVMGVLGAGAYFGVQSIQRSAADATPDGEAPVEAAETTTIEVLPPPPVLEAVIGSTEAVVRERAQERFLTSTQAVIRDLRSIPDVWPEQAYLTLPSGYPDVLEIWQDYLATIRRVRSGDDDRYRTAYEAALDDAAVQGEARDTRLQVAMSDLAAVASRRNEHYDRVEALASAAIQSHNALLQSEGLILFDVTGTTGVQNGIGLGAYGRDADSQLLLDQVLDLLSATLDGDGLGPGDGTNVREWVWDGFLDAVAN